MKQSVSDMIDKDYRSYSMYTIENRAIPSIIDGFKPVQRKIFYAMDKKFNGKKTKVNDLGSISDIGYHHGESSAQSAAVGMAQAWANNIPEFISHGTFGTRLVPEAAAPRYIFASENPILKKIFLDKEILQDNPEDDQHEPSYYLPIIPWLFVNGSRGMAVGFANLILPRDPKQIIKDVASVLGGNRSYSYTLPSFPAFKGSVELLEQPSKVIVKGVVEKGKKNTLIIKEAPFNESRESMHVWLEKLIEKDKIEDFFDGSDKNGFNITVKLSQEQMKKAEADPVEYLGLTKTINENFTVLDEHGKIKVFQNYWDALLYFVDFRLEKTKEAINTQIQLLEMEELFKSIKIEFIYLAMDWLRNNPRINLEQIKALKKEACDTFNASIHYADGVEKTPIYDLSDEMIEKLNREKQEIHSKIKQLQKTDPVKYYLDRLGELEKHL